MKCKGHDGKIMLHYLLAGSAQLLLESKASCSIRLAVALLDKMHVQDMVHNADLCCGCHSYCLPVNNR